MKTSRFLLDQDEIQLFTQKLSLIETLQDGTIKYKEAETGRFWVKYQVDSMYLGKPYACMLSLPEANTAELIDIIFSTEDRHEMIAAALKLRDNETNYNIHFRDELINVIEKLPLEELDEQQKHRVRTIILFSELDHGENRKQVVGKHHTEIKKDAEYYMSIAHRAYNILEKLGFTD